MDEARVPGQPDADQAGNYWRRDPTIRREVERVLEGDTAAWSTERLDAFGELVETEVAPRSDSVDAVGPTLSTHDRRGRRVNRVEYPPEHLANERAVYEAGIVADSFAPPPGRDEVAPVTHYLAMLYLLSYADVGLACPVAMSAGAAYVLERYGDEATEPYFEALRRRDYDDCIEGAMFLTEEQGGSDVGATATEAVSTDDGWRLTGEKWFCSNIDAEATLTLARTPGAPDGTDGLSMFLVPHGRPDAGVVTKGDRADGPLAPAALNDQRYRRLKDKLGTISVPTGEVELEGAHGLLVGEEGRGFKQMAEMLNIERLSNAAAAAGLMGRALLESRDHAADREAFGSPIDTYPLMRADLVDMAVDHEAATAFTMDAGAALAERMAAERRGDTAAATDAYRLLRALVPVAKLRTGRMAVDTASYAMEIQGGNGYVREFVTHRLLRDAQVLPIWEGTENILSLDLLRSFASEGSHAAVLERIDERLDGVDHAALADLVEVVAGEREGLADAIDAVATTDREGAELAAKRVAHYLFDVYTAALLVAEADQALDDDARLALVARRFVDRQLVDHAARGVPRDDRLAVDHFAAIVHHDPVDPTALERSVTAD